MTGGTIKWVCPKCGEEVRCLGMVSLGPKGAINQCRTHGRVDALPVQRVAASDTKAAPDA